MNDHSGLSGHRYPQGGLPDLLGHLSLLVTTQVAGAFSVGEPAVWYLRSSPVVIRVHLAQQHVVHAQIQSAGVFLGFWHQCS